MKTIQAMNILKVRKQLGEDITRIRERTKLSKNKIMQKTGLQRSQILGIENGSKAYTIDTLLAILDVLESNLKIE